MYRTERIFILSALLFIGMGLTLATSRGVLGRGTAVPEAVVWLLAFSLIVVAGVGALWLRRGFPASATTLPNASLPIMRVPLDMIVPATMVAGFVIFFGLFEDGVLQALLVAAAGLALAGLFWAQLHGSDIADPLFSLAQTVLNIVSHLTAFLLFSAIYGLKVRALFSATAVAVVTALLIYEMLQRDTAWHRAMGLPVEGRRTTLALLSLAAGAVAAEITWGLNYWAALPTLVGGAFLLVVFYVIYGLVSHYVDHKLTRNVLAEFGAVGAVSLAVIFVSAFFS